MSSADPRRAFTLLEVMAAVALLGILYTVLARVAIEGLRAEGESERRLQASQLADQRLADTFTTTDGAVVMPAIGHSEVTEGPFTLALDVSLFQPPTDWGLNAAPGVPPLLFASAPGAPGAQALRTVELTVSWLEGDQAREVSRTMFLLDFSQLASIAGSAGTSGAGAGAAAGAAGRGAPPPQGGTPPPSELEAP